MNLFEKNTWGDWWFSEKITKKYNKIITKKYDKLIKRCNKLIKSKRSLNIGIALGCFVNILALLIGVNSLNMVIAFNLLVIVISMEYVVWNFE